MLKLLIDECLSTSLVGIARGRGHIADHVTWLGQSGRKDWNLMPVVQAENSLFVTNNRADFLKLHGREELPAGLVVILPNVSRHPQMRLFALALDHLETLPDFINQVMLVAADGTLSVRPHAAPPSFGLA